jgi:hypothetical protein
MLLKWEHKNMQKGNFKYKNIKMQKCDFSLLNFEKQHLKNGQLKVQ